MGALFVLLVVFLYQPLRPTFLQVFVGASTLMMTTLALCRFVPASLVVCELCYQLSPRNQRLRLCVLLRCVKGLKYHFAFRTTSSGFDSGRALAKDLKSMLTDTTDELLFEISCPAVRALTLFSKFPQLLRGKRSRNRRSGNREGDRGALASVPLTPRKKIYSSLHMDRKADRLHKLLFNLFVVCRHEITGGYIDDEARTPDADVLLRTWDLKRN